MRIREVFLGTDIHTNSTKRDHTFIMQSNELTPKQQTVELLKQAESVLIVTGRQPTVDQVVSVVALQSALAKLGKKSQAVISDNLPPATQVVDTSRISRDLDGVRDFVVSLDLAHVEVDKLKYDVIDNRLDITITPHSGNFKEEDARFGYGAYQFDLVVVIGVPSILKIDGLLEQNPTLFDGLHLINLDYHRINEQYGSVNLIDSAATSTSEMLMSIMEALSQGMIDEEIGTALLTGIMSATNRFTTASTTPKALTMAAQLMSGGARQQTVVRALYGDSAPRQSAPAQRAESKPETPQKLADALPQETVAQLQQAAEALQSQAPQEAEITELPADQTPPQTIAQDVQLRADTMSFTPGMGSFLATPQAPSRLQ